MSGKDRPRPYDDDCLQQCETGAACERLGSIASMEPGSETYSDSSNGRRGRRPTPHELGDTYGAARATVDPLAGGPMPLLDARAAGRLLGVPDTWLLAQAREGRIPHHRLGRYVRFSAADLHDWLIQNRFDADPLADRRRRPRS